jgi:transposase
MAEAYSQDLRDRVLAARDQGLKTKQVAQRLAVSPAWVRRVVQRRREHGETGPRPRGGATVVKIDLVQLRELVRQQPDATIKELHQRLGAACCESAVGAALQRLGLSFKKRRCTPPSRTGRTWPRPAPSGNRPNPSSPPAG